MFHFFTFTKFFLFSWTLPPIWVNYNRNLWNIASHQSNSFWIMSFFYVEGPCKIDHMIIEKESRCGWLLKIMYVTNIEMCKLDCWFSVIDHINQPYNYCALVISLFTGLTLGTPKSRPLSVLVWVQIGSCRNVSL